MALAAVAGRDAGLVDAPNGPVVRRFADAYGIEKSVVSEQFIEASRQNLRELIERPLGDLKLCGIHHMNTGSGRPRNW